MKVVIKHISGYMREYHVWQMLGDLAELLQAHEVNPVISPENIIWNGESFCFGELRNDAPADEKEQIWDLAASAFYLFMGCQVFAGGGRAAQHEASPLPYMRKSLPRLSNCVCQMLAFNPKDRPTLADIQHEAEANVKRLKNTERSRPVKIKQQTNIDSTNDFWPDDFQ